MIVVNFIQQPLPKGSTAGNSVGPGIITSRVPGALGLGQRASTAISTCMHLFSSDIKHNLNLADLTLVNSFWAYIMPLVGAYIAEEHLGRFRTIMYSIACALVGHTILHHLRHTSSYQESEWCTSMLRYWSCYHGCRNWRIQVCL